MYENRGWGLQTPIDSAANLSLSVGLRWLSFFLTLSSSLPMHFSAGFSQSSSDRSAFCSTILPNCKAPSFSSRSRYCRGRLFPLFSCRLGPRASFSTLRLFMFTERRGSHRHYSDYASTEKFHRDADSHNDAKDIPDERNMSSSCITDVDIILVNEHYVSPSDVFKKFLAKVRRTHPLRLAWVVTLILLVTAGNAMQIIGLNFWLHHFSQGGAPGNFTTLAVSGLLFGIFFLFALVVYIIVKRPSLTFARSARGWRLIFLIGLMDAVNSSMAIYAASYTPEVLQALFTSLVPIYSAGFTKWILRDPRKYMNCWVTTSFFLIVAGVVMASAHQFAHGFKEDAGSRIWWSVIFFLSVPPTVLMNVWQSLYMIEFTHDPIFQATYHCPPCEGFISCNSREKMSENSINLESEVIPSKRQQGVGSGQTNASPPSEASIVCPTQGMDTIVKLVMLAGETNIQFILIMLTLPMDALPWWGGSDSVSSAWTNFSNGVLCIFRCELNYLFCIVYTTGFVFTYVGSAYLNQYSVTLCSMIGQLSSPFTALLLIIVPSWNLEKGYTPWYMSAVAVVLLSVASLIYALWEEKTEAEKLEGERILKEELLRHTHTDVGYVL